MAAVLLNRMDAALKSLGLNFSRNNENNFLYCKIDGVQFVFDTKNNGKGWMTYLVSDDRVPEQYRLQAAKTIAEINYSLNIGDFEINWDNGSVRYKISLAWETDTDFDEYFKASIALGLRTYKNNIGRIIVSSGDNIDAELAQALEKGETLLFVLCRKNDIPGVEAEIKKGANVNHRSNSGGTPLIAATCRGNERVCELLLNAGARVNSENEQNDTAFSLAIFKRQPSVALLLLRRGADYNHVDKFGDTPLMDACRFGQIDVVKALLDKQDIDVNHKNKDGETALSRARKEGHQAIVNLLVAKGAKG